MMIDLIYDDENYFVVNKPAGMAVERPAKTTTLIEALTNQKIINPTIWKPDERYGVVHRLDSDTSGVIILAKNQETQAKLKLLWQGRTVKKKYLALAAGSAELSGQIELSIERDNKNDRQVIAWLQSSKARPAITSYQKIGEGRIGENPVSLLEVHPITGRTHQIRVHLKAINHPIVGDRLYGDKRSIELAVAAGLNRQFLHAASLQFIWNQQEVCYRANLPSELLRVLELSGINW
jgi:23S rRNA pseudouridine1911/1915/1917 synthase